MNISLLSLLLILPLFINALDDVWGNTGHRVVGAIADDYLKCKTKKAIEKILDYQSLALVSTFGDEIKSDKRYNDFYTWHYINMPLDVTYENSTKNPDGDLVSGIEFCKSVIQDENSSLEDKAFYLKLLIHLIGDLHQPLHIGLEEDRGGNDVKVKWHHEDSNLHRVWDSDMIERYGMSYSELAQNAKALTKKEVKALQQGSIIDWVNETHQLTKKVYADIEPESKLGYPYSYKHFDTVRDQLQVAGIRLAKVLNDLF